MQFHLNGFRPGDPAVLSDESAAADGTTPPEVDVLIVGCGPAGLTLAAQLAAFPDISTCIVEQLEGPLQRGRADGIACRTMEMFNAFGFADRLLREAYWVNETTFWKPDRQQPEHIARHGRVQDVEDGLSEFPHVILNQARVHDFYLELMQRSVHSLTPHYARQLTALTTDDSMVDDVSAYPVAATLAHHSGTETVRAKYVVGCDGARSAVRSTIGLTLKGDAANQAWGVMDVLMVTDFPDIRMKSLIQSSNQGSIVVIPREGGYLVRLYVELGSLEAQQRVSDIDVSPELLIDKANAIFYPYTLDVKEVAWWSVYEIGQRLCERFDDVPDSQRGQRMPRVFIAGDACHTHSPKAGQGMNVSMRDTFNLGWKLASVLRGQAAPALLDTYTAERHKVAQTLIDFDREWSAILAGRPNADTHTSDDAGISAEFQNYFIQHGRYTAGTAIQYETSLITATPNHQHLAGGFELGTRFHSAQVTRVADGKPMQLGHVAQADGRWRLYIFADNCAPEDPQSAVGALCDYLMQHPQSPLNRFATNNTRTTGNDSQSDIDALLDVRVVYQQHWRDVILATLPSLLLPHKGRYQLIDYEKVFCADTGVNIFDLRSIDRTQGAMVLVRPDQHIAHVLPLTSHHALAEFFAGFLIERQVS